MNKEDIVYFLAWLGMLVLGAVGTWKLFIPSIDSPETILDWFLIIKFTMAFPIILGFCIFVGILYVYITIMKGAE